MILSGQAVVLSAGTAVRLASAQTVNAPVMVKALPTNNGLVAVGNVDGDVTLSNGFLLQAGEAVVFGYVGNLAEVWVDAANNGEGAAWLVLEV